MKDKNHLSTSIFPNYLICKSWSMYKRLVVLCFAAPAHVLRNFTDIKNYVTMFLCV